MGYAVQQNQTSQHLVFFLVNSSDHISGATGKTPIVTLSKNGAAFASPAGGVYEIGKGWYAVSGNLTDSNTLGPLLLNASGSATDPFDDTFNVVSYNPLDATRLGLTSLPTSIPNASGGIITLGPGSGQINQTYFGTLDVNVAPSSLPVVTASVVSGVWNANPDSYSGINSFGYQNRAMYYADIKQYYDLTNGRDEYCVDWYRNSIAFGSGSVTNSRISVYNTITGAAMFENAALNYVGANIGALRYNEPTNILTSGEPYHVIVSGTIDGSTRIWQRVIGRNKLM